ncbi:hypothetical protein J6590_088043 [Homalodisca vitripennis]|nr:hypothetical protein J6590_088043 [Homalodisca vitripennis]
MMLDSLKPKRLAPKADSITATAVTSRRGAEMTCHTVTVYRQQLPAVYYCYKSTAAE